MKDPDLFYQPRNRNYLSIFVDEHLDNAHIVVVGNDADMETQMGMTMANGFLEYGDHKVAIDAIPVNVLHAMAQTTFSHKLGNEVDSKVTARIRGKEYLGSDATKDAVTAWREANKSQVDTWSDTFRTETCNAIVNGTLGLRVGGPRKDPVDTKFNDLVLKSIHATIKHLPSVLKAFKKGASDAVIDFGGGMTRVKSDMIAARVATHGDTLRKEAEKMVREEARLAKRAEDSSEGSANPDALGF